ncbi:response regulator [Gilvimarinus algae]|uniref:Response regulator n=1 Tax=Gilvimarinus algae TaxID=3058037 RepID=A0ABT8TEF0_9GAMM|nr:response regulator [Gilvimarinus sp. SDUM040014]MDO3382477.1 response regulator [Gilvimarinus sp. SDUM040014]
MQFSREEQALITETLKQRQAWLSKTLPTLEGEQRSRAEQLLGQLKTILGKFQQKAGSASEPQSGSDVRILVVDDDEYCAKLLVAQLEELGFDNVDMAKDGQEAINLMYDTPLPYDMILSDWNMPIKNGLEVHSAMLAAERYDNSQFVMTTSITQASQIREAIDHGVNDYLAKPIDVEALQKKLQRFFPNVKS